MDKTMANKLMYIPNYDAQNYPFCRFKLQVAMFKPNEWINQDFLKSPKL